MHNHQNDSSEGIAKLQDDFNKTIDFVYNSLGNNAFKNFSRGVFTKKFHPAIYDSIMVAAYFAIEAGKEVRTIDEDIHKQLLLDETYSLSISKRTTNVDHIKNRIRLAGKVLFGIDIL